MHVIEAAKIRKHQCIIETRNQRREITFKKLRQITSKTSIEIGTNQVYRSIIANKKSTELAWNDGSRVRRLLYPIEI